MSDDDRTKWNERYSRGDYEPRTAPSPLVEAATRIVPPGRCLVLACGTGRNALRLAESGFEVEAVDISEFAIDKAKARAEQLGLEVNWRVADIEDLQLETAGYDLITMVRYLNRRIWPRVLEALRPNAWLLVEQHFQTRRGVLGPTDPAFRLTPGELLNAFPGLRIVSYSETMHHDLERDGQYAIASMLACRGDPGW